MDHEKRYMMLACRNIEDEIEAAMKEAGTDFPVLYMPSGTHNFPDKMNGALQRIIDSITDIDYLLLPMGRCGNATLNLCSHRFSLVLPKCEDCINLLLSEDSLKVDRPKGCMFFTEGWLRSSQSVQNELDRTEAKFGKDKSQMVMQMIYGGYSDFGILNTGLYNMERAKETLRPLAEMIPVNFKELKAPYGILKKMAALELENENFAVIPPGVKVTESMLDYGSGVR